MLMKQYFNNLSDRIKQLTGCSDKDIIIVCFIVIVLSVLLTLVMVCYNRYKSNLTADAETKTGNINASLYRPDAKMFTHSTGCRLLTNCEIDYYNLFLQQLCNESVTIVPQICLRSFIKSNKYNSSDLYKIVDFVILNTYTEVIAVIEINDNSHYQNDRMLRDEFVHEVLENSNIPLITVWTREGLNVNIVNKLKEVGVIS